MTLAGDVLSVGEAMARPTRLNKMYEAGLQFRLRIRAPLQLDFTRFCGRPRTTILSLSHGPTLLVPSHFDAVTPPRVQ